METLVKDYRTVAEDIGKLLGTGVVNVQFDLKPIRDDQKPEKLGCYDVFGRVFNKQTANELEQQLLEAKFTLHADRVYIDDVHYKRLKKDGVEICVYYVIQPTREEEIARLKARLAELGCND